MTDKPKPMLDIRVEVDGELRGRYASIEVMQMHMANLFREYDEERKKRELLEFALTRLRDGLWASNISQFAQNALDEMNDV